MVLVKFMRDVSLIPNESAWFGYQDRNGNVVPMEETFVYKNDRLGLQRMKNEGKLILIESPLEHLELDKVWFRETLIPILKEK